MDEKNRPQVERDPAGADRLGNMAGEARTRFIEAEPAGIKPWAEISIEEKIERLRDHARNHSSYFEHINARLTYIGGRVGKLARQFYYHAHRGDDLRPVVPAEEHNEIAGELSAKSAARPRGTLD